MKIYTNELRHMTKIAVMPICDKIYSKKNFTNLLLQNQLDVSLETRYEALGTQVLPRLSKLRPWIGLDLSYDKVKYGKMLEQKILWKVLKSLV